MAFTATFTAATTQKFLGLGQLFTNLLRHNQVDTEQSDISNAYRDWEVKLTHRIGALIRDDTLTVETPSLGITREVLGKLPDTAYRTVLKKAEGLDGRWISAIRVQLVQAGTRTSTHDGIVIPTNEGTDWVFRIETYNSAHPEIEYYSLNTSGTFQTFHALKKESTTIAWKHYSENGALVKQVTPFTVTGIQSLINVLFGYIHRLEELGFRINFAEHVITDDETGRNLDWQLEIEKLVNRIYSNLGPGQGHILNPFMHALWVETPTGLLSRFVDVNFADIAGAQALFDVNGDVIPVTALDVIRTDERAVIYSDTPIFSGHLFVDEYEHAIIFNDQISEDSELHMFEPFLGLRSNSVYLSYIRQQDITKKPHFPGFILVGDNLKRNITSSVDAVGNYYDPARTFEQEQTADHALALLGFNKKEYFDAINSNHATQFNFWRGLIQAKGTNTSIDAYVNYRKFTKADVDEYWAYKLAEYGDARRRQFPELKIQVADCLQKFTQLQFFDELNSSYEPLNLFTQIEATDDTRWFSIDDLGQGLTFKAQPIEVVVTDPALGYHYLSDIFHNGDSEPTIWARVKTTNLDGEPVIVSETNITDTPATPVKIINSKLIKILGSVPLPPGYWYEYVMRGHTWSNQTKVSPVKLFDYVDDELIKEIGLWHPAIGLHANEGLDVVNSITSLDPALYNVTGQTTNNPNYVTLKAWGKKEVGRVWWDTSNLGYIPYYDARVFPDRNERHARWGNLAEWASVDLYEWVESDVPPSEYDALASAQQGQSDLDDSMKASGNAARKQYYSRNRIITVRPIAWSHSGVGSSAAHPAFGPAFSQKVRLVGGALYVESGRTSDIDIVEDRHFGAWKNNTPYGEAVIGSELVYDLGSTIALSIPQLIESGIITKIEARAIPDGRLGRYIGEITLSSRLEQLDTAEFTQRLRMSDKFGHYEDVTITDWFADSEDDKLIQFTQFGIEIYIERTISNTTYTAVDIVTDVINSWSDIYVREGVRCVELIPLPDTIFINDEEDPDVPTHEYGWKTWDVPTQIDLDSDLAIPYNSWQPYLGAAITVQATASVISEMTQDTLILKNGIPVKRYASTWSDWIAITETRIEKISTGGALINIQRSEFLNASEELDTNRINVYANGILMNPNNYSILGDSGEESLQIVNTLPEGTAVLFIYRAYQPTEAELEFDSSVEDNPSVQTEFKADYQYTKIDVRGESGMVIGAKYYFWVENSTVIRPNKSKSLASAKALLTYGPSQFAMFGRLVDGEYDSIVLTGLSYLVTNNDTYKLRFANNDTLRDDPEEMSLKNVHTEWVLMRRSQNSRIPLKLWQQLTDAVAGQDIGGNPLPSPVRVDYDARRGTNTRFGFKPGQILADTELVRATIKNTILNTSLELRIGNTVMPDYISALNFDEADAWFATPESARQTMDLIWGSARAKQINEIFFEVLEDALANNYEFSDIFKTSLISVNATSKVDGQSEGELADSKF